LVDSEVSAGGEANSGRQEDRLDSWKRIASYLKRDVITVQRWERREGMPVHRHVHDKQGTVFAFRSELDEWWEGRRAGLAAPDTPGSERPALITSSVGRLAEFRRRDELCIDKRAAPEGVCIHREPGAAAESLTL
jgi:hypothetical protein